VSDIRYQDIQVVGEHNNDQVISNADSRQQVSPRMGDGMYAAPKALVVNKINLPETDSRMVSIQLGLANSSKPPPKVSGFSGLLLAMSGAYCISMVFFDTKARAEAGAPTVKTYWDGPLGSANVAASDVFVGGGTPDARMVWVCPPDVVAERIAKALGLGALVPIVRRLWFILPVVTGVLGVLLGRSFF
jgi:hypothetical protein